MTAAKGLDMELRQITGIISLIFKFPFNLHQKLKPEVKSIIFMYLIFLLFF